MNKINDALLDDFDNNLKEIKELVPEYLKSIIDKYIKFKNRELEFDKEFKIKEKEISENKEGLSEKEINNRILDLLDEQDENKAYNDGYKNAIIYAINYPRNLSGITNENLQNELEQIIEEPISSGDNYSYGYNSAQEDIIFALDTFLNGPKEKIEKIDISLKERVPKWMHFAIDKYLSMDHFLKDKQSFNSYVYREDYGEGILSVLNNVNEYGITDKNNSIESIKNMTSLQLKDKMNDFNYLSNSGQRNALEDLYMSRFDELNNNIRVYDASIFNADNIYNLPSYKDLKIKNLDLNEIIEKEANEIKAFEKCVSRMATKTDLSKLISAIDSLPEEKKKELFKDNSIKSLYDYMKTATYAQRDKTLEYVLLNN